MSEETATAATGEASAQAATQTGQPEPERKAPDWEAAYKGIQRAIGKRDQRIEELSRELQTRTAPLKSDLDVLLRGQLGEDGYKAHQQAQVLEQERQQALAAAQAAQQFIPQSIAVIAETMRLAGVADADIQQVFASARDTANVEEWGAAVKAGTQIAIAKVKTQEATKVQEQAKATDRAEIEAEAIALAERTLRAKGIDKVDLGKGQSSADRGFVSKVKAIDRSTTEGETAFQQMIKDAKRGTLKT